MKDNTINVFDQPKEKMTVKDVSAVTETSEKSDNKSPTTALNKKPVTTQSLSLAELINQRHNSKL